MDCESRKLHALHCICRRIFLCTKTSKAAQGAAIAVDIEEICNETRERTPEFNTTDLTISDFTSQENRHGNSETTL
jgi:hypothetical protein